MFGLFRKPQDPVAPLHGDIVAAARDRRLYAELGVRDDFTGRFEVVAIVTTLVLRRLKDPSDGGAAAEQGAQALVDRLFAAFDRDLREIGIGDVSVPKTMKHLAGNFYGRAGAYAAALAAEKPEAALFDVLLRNLYGGALPAGVDPRPLVAGIVAMAERLACLSVPALLAGGALGQLLPPATAPIATPPAEPCHARPS